MNKLVQKWREYRKGVIVALGVALSMLSDAGVILPEFLTAEYVDRIIEAITVVLVVAVPNQTPT